MASAKSTVWKELTEYKSMSNGSVLYKCKDSFQSACECQLQPFHCFFKIAQKKMSLNIQGRYYFFFLFFYTVNIIFKVLYLFMGEVQNLEFDATRETFYKSFD